VDITNIKFKVKLDPDNSDRIWFQTDDPRIVPQDDGAGPGLWIVFDGRNDESRDYNPRYYNRLAAMLRAAGEPAPEHDAPVRSRKLSDRDAARD
jgi:hypothetical protein